MTRKPTMSQFHDYLLAHNWELRHYDPAGHEHWWHPSSADYVDESYSWARDDWDAPSDMLEIIAGKEGRCEHEILAEMLSGVDPALLDVAEELDREVQFRMSDGTETMYDLHNSPCDCKKQWRRIYAGPWLEDEDASRRLPAVSEDLPGTDAPADSPSPSETPREPSEHPMSVLRLRPDDVIVFRSEHELDVEIHRELERGFRECFPNHRALVVSGFSDISVIRPVDDEEETS